MVNESALLVEWRQTEENWRSRTGRTQSHSLHHIFCSDSPGLGEIPLRLESTLQPEYTHVVYSGICVLLAFGCVLFVLLTLAFHECFYLLGQHARDLVHKYGLLGETWWFHFQSKIHKDEGRNFLRNAY